MGLRMPARSRLDVGGHRLHERDTYWWLLWRAPILPWLCLQWRRLLCRGARHWGGCVPRLPWHLPIAAQSTTVAAATFATLTFAATALAAAFAATALGFAAALATNATWKH